MNSTWLGTLKENAAAAIGWSVFLGLIAATFAGRYIFNPFVFGFGYYTIYALSRIGNKNDSSNADLLGRRTLALGVIALLALWIDFRKEMDTHQFIRQFERTCYRGPKYDEGEVRRICEEIQAHIDSTLQKETEFSDER